MTLADKIRTKRLAREAEQKKAKAAAKPETLSAGEKKTLRQMLAIKKETQQETETPEKKGPETIEEFFASKENMDFLKTLLKREQEKLKSEDSEKKEPETPDKKGELEEPKAEDKHKPLINLENFSEEEIEEMVVLIDDEKKKRLANGQMQEQKQEPEQPHEEPEKQAEIVDLTVLKRTLEASNQRLDPRTSQRTVEEMEAKIAEIAARQGVTKENLGIVTFAFKDKTNLSDSEIEQAVSAQVSQFPALQRSTKIPSVAGSHGGSYVPEVKYEDLTQLERDRHFINKATNR